ncbi:hypothetical protein [Sulfuricurvum sp.]|uniref:hypothetical protein n=1 Tax=Sulfuricurvum sp. TaxID=2025608 RepID=UPI00356ADC9C
MSPPENFLRVELTDEEQEYINLLRKKFGKGYVSGWVRGLIDKEMSEDEQTLTIKENHYQMKLEEIKARKQKLSVQKEKVEEIVAEKENDKREIALKLIDQAKDEVDLEKAKRLCIRAYRAGITLKEMKQMIKPELHQLVLKTLTRQV